MCDSETIFEREPWFNSRPEPILRLVGSLEPREEALGPATRGGLAFTFRGAESDLPVYAAGVEARLRSLTGRRVTIQGRIVEIGQTRELWIGRITTR